MSTEPIYHSPEFYAPEAESQCAMLMEKTWHKEEMAQSKEPHE